jgi:hypothetical protein
MKTAALLLATIFPCLAQQDGSVVRFSNGDRLTGDLLALNGEKLSWKSQLLKEPAEFDLKYVVDLELPVGAPPAGRPEAAHEAMISMTNGDTIRGQLAGITDTEIRLATWYAEELILKRVNVKSAKISSIADIYYRGPNSIEEWTNRDGGDGWTFRGGALTSDAPGGLRSRLWIRDGFPRQLGSREKGGDEQLAGSFHECRCAEGKRNSRNRDKSQPQKRQDRSLC